MDVQRTKIIEAQKNKDCGYYYETKQDKLVNIPGTQIGYWLSDKFIESFEKYPLLGSIADAKQGLATADNNRFLRLWYEVVPSKVNYSAHDIDEAVASGKKWFPYNKGGDFRKWYGNNEYLVNWENDGYEIKHMFDEKGKLRSRPQNIQYFFRESVSWSLVSSSVAAFRYKPYGHIFDIAGMSLFSPEHLYYLLALCNSKYAMKALAVIAPTINYQCGDIACIPVNYDRGCSGIIEELTRENITISKNEWDSFETSWDFQCHPLAPMACERQEQLIAGMNSEECKKAVTLLSERYRHWEQKCEYRFKKLKKNEEELNRIFIDIYGLQDELSPDVEDKDVTVRKADLQRDIRGLMSYAVGCMFGRYSLDVPGLVYAGGTWDASKYTTFQPDKDAIIPICDDEYFDDDIVGRFVKFIEVVYGKETLEENLKFIADALGGKGTSREVIRNYFINDFYADHLKVYQKRPIYWLFDSGKKNGFKCLVYMHRYQPDTIARIRTDYVHEQQSRYRTAIEDLEQHINGVSTSERVRLNKQLSILQAQAKEIRSYEEKIHHLADQMIKIDLDNGVKHNYAIFKDVLAKIR